MAPGHERALLARELAHFRERLGYYRSLHSGTAHPVETELASQYNRA